MFIYKRSEDRKMHNIVKYIKILYILQVILLFIIMIYRLVGKYVFHKLKLNINTDFIILFLVILMIVNGYLVMRDVIQLKKWKERIKLREEAYSYIEKLNRDLRMQRHDFLNHIQIIYSLMELEEYNECVEYLNKIYEHIGKLNKNIKTDKVAINALLQAKSNEADKLHIQYQVIITTRLSNLIIPEWELCRCLGNLIDNAFRATIEYNGNRNISIMIEEDLVSYQLSVHNVGNPIKIEYIDKLFEEGFTTKEKNNQEHGIGLYIVKDILDKYNSNIDIKRIDDKTVFTIRIPKEKV